MSRCDIASFSYVAIITIFEAITISKIKGCHFFFFVIIGDLDAAFHAGIGILTVFGEGLIDRFGTGCGHTRAGSRRCSQREGISGFGIESGEDRFRLPLPCTVLLNPVFHTVFCLKRDAVVGAAFENRRVIGRRCRLVIAVLHDLERAFDRRSGLRVADTCNRRFREVARGGFVNIVIISDGVIHTLRKAHFSYGHSHRRFNRAAGIGLDTDGIHIRLFNFDGKNLEFFGDTGITGITSNEVYCNSPFSGVGVGAVGVFEVAVGG